MRIAGECNESGARNLPARKDTSTTDGSNTKPAEAGRARAAQHPPLGHEEQRREPRYLPNRLVEILPCRAASAAAGGSNWEFRPAELIDCSANGVGLIADVPMQVGEQFILKIKLVKWTLLHYVVRDCTSAPAPRGHYRIGAQLLGYIDATRHHEPEVVLRAMMSEVCQDAESR
jgi:hypothetical protein